jgi:signal peptidase I
MAHTLLAGDHVLANKLIYGSRVPILARRLPAVRTPRPGDVVLFRHPDDPAQLFIKRCVAAAGQEVSTRDGALLVDGVPYAGASDERVPEEISPTRVPSGMLFVIGDNLVDSWDSRHWGFLPSSDVVGKAEIILWSQDPSRRGPTGTRWDRIGRRVH